MGLPMNEYVGALIRNPKDEILLQKKTWDYKPWPGHWTIFGGGIEPEDNGDIFAAFDREIVEEETGLELHDVKFFESVAFDEMGYEYKNRVSGICHFIEARFDGDLSKIRLGEGAGFAMFDSKELPGIRNKMFPYIYETIDRLYGGLE